MKRVLVLGLLLLVGCSGEDPTGEAGTTAPPPSASSTSGPSTSGPSTPPSTSPPSSGGPADGIPIEAFAMQIERNDARADAEAVLACADADPVDPDCAAEVTGLALSAQGLAFQLDRLGTPVAEVADLVATTISTALATQEAVDTYIAACPEAAATSDQCKADLLTLATGQGKLLIKTIKGWKPYL